MRFNERCRCHWNGEICKPEYFTSTLTDLGMCYTFNSNQDNALISAKTGNIINTYATLCEIITSMNSNVLEQT